MGFGAPQSSFSLRNAKAMRTDARSYTSFIPWAYFFSTKAMSIVPKMWNNCFEGVDGTCMSLVVLIVGGGVACAFMEQSTVKTACPRLRPQGRTEAHVSLGLIVVGNEPT